MARSTGQKLKLLYLYKIFFEETDEEHPLTLAEIQNKLQYYEINAERKSLYDDFDQLKTFGVELQREEYGYAMIGREFELAELKVLIDVVQASNFITKSESKKLIDKIKKCASKYGAKKLERQVSTSNRIKSPNKKIFYNVDAIHNAIHGNQRITFQYFDWTVKKTQKFRREGKIYKVSPFSLHWDDENYYLIGCDDEDHMKHYRVDKMDGVQASEERRQIPSEYKTFDTGNYSNQIFGMYGGESMRVTLRFCNDLIGVVIDRFGQEIRIKEENDRFIIKTDVIVSKQFLGWLFGLGGGVEIVAPLEVRERYREMARIVLGENQ